MNLMFMVGVECEWLVGAGARAGSAVSLLYTAPLSPLTLAVSAGRCPAECWRGAPVSSQQFLCRLVHRPPPPSPALHWWSPDNMTLLSQQTNVRLHSSIDYDNYDIFALL